MPDGVRDGDLVLVLGAKGLVGSGVVRALARAGHAPARMIEHDRMRCDLSDQRETRRYVGSLRPDAVVLAAALVGGIRANAERPAEFALRNAEIQSNVVGACARAGTRVLVGLGSACIYPRACAQPMREEDLWTGALEPTNAAYAAVKLALVSLVDAHRAQHASCAGWFTVQPINVYGPNDNFHRDWSHVLPALIRRFHEAKAAKAPRVEMWGTGAAVREFVHADDVGDAVVHLMRSGYSGPIVNVGTGSGGVTIRGAAEAVAEAIGYRGEIAFDGRAELDGMPVKTLDCSRLAALGWTAKIKLAEGVRATYDWYCTRGPGSGRAYARM